MEVGEGRAFVTGVIDGLRFVMSRRRRAEHGLMNDRKIAASREQQRKDRDREELENGYSGTAADSDDEMDMQ
jgi:GINS complex subunit 2